MIYNVYEKSTGNLLMKLRFYNKKTKDSFLKNFRKLKRQIDIVEVKE